MVGAKKDKISPCGLYHLDSASHRSKVKASQAGRSPGSHLILTLSTFPEGKLHFQKRNYTFQWQKFIEGLSVLTVAGAAADFHRFPY